MRLIDLLNGQDINIAAQGISGHVDITGLTCDSRAVRKGYLFAALPGVRVDGRDFIGKALDKGAACVLAPRGTLINGPVLLDENPRLLFAKMVSNFFARQPANIAAVTGTNGKTSVATFVRQIWQRMNIKAASLGTIGLQGAGFDEPGTLTTPDPVKIHETLKRLSEADVDHLAIEASSHGLEQYRLDGVNISAAGFTNLTRDHLDYHGDMETYMASKMRLLTEVVNGHGSAVINADIAQAHTIVKAATQRGLNVMTYGQKGEYLHVVKVEPCDGGQKIWLEIQGRSYTLILPLVGGFQVENAMCALGLVLALGADESQAVETLNGLEGVPGRLQFVGLIHGAQVYVDFAHTPDALKTLLKTLRPFTQHKLHVLFGCGGDRDCGKRPEMGRVAVEYADRVIVTDDNPRHEDPDQIRNEILAVAPGAVDIGDRYKAIQIAIEHLNAGDVLVLAGKGHEQGQLILDKVLPFDDVSVATKVIRELDT